MKETSLIEDLVAANRVLAMHGVLDGFGHVSVRHDRDANRFLLSRSLAPELVTAADIMEYDLDATPVDDKGRASYLERFIHAAIYKARPDVRLPPIRGHQFEGGTRGEAARSVGREAVLQTRPPGAAQRILPASARRV